MKWQPCQLQSLCAFATSGGTPSTSQAHFYGGTIPWLRTQEVTFNRITETEMTITEDGLANSAARWIPEHSVIVAMYGNSAGRVAVNMIPLTTNQACCNLILDASKADYRFIFYRLMLDYEVLRQMAKGAAQNNLNAGQVKSYTIRAPDVMEQRAIADVLSAYDDLIENNRRRMKLLEESARQLYREWFVRLRFPGHERVKITNSLPAGWVRKRIGDIADCVGGGTPSTAVPAYWEDGTVTWITPTDVTNNQHFVLLDGEKKISEAGLKNSSAKLVPSHAVLMTSRASVGYFAVTGREVCTNQGFISIVPQDPLFSMFLLYQRCCRVEEIRSMGSGATYPEVSRGKFREFQVLVPIRSLVAEFDEQATLLLAQIRNLKVQNQKISVARDLLLPKLMSGEIAV